MGAEIANVSGHLLTLKVSGTLTQKELASVQATVASIIGKGSTWRLLVLIENFAGWERGATWDDFSSEDDSRIERMAIVGERKWEDMALLFIAKGLRPFPIEYFEPPQLAAARDWLARPI